MRPARGLDMSVKRRVPRKEAEVGFEPTNNGFAIRPLSPLGYSAGASNSIDVHLSVQVIAWHVTHAHRPVRPKTRRRTVCGIFTAPYTESLYLVLALWCMLRLREGRWGTATVAAGLASATRVTAEISSAREADHTGRPAASGFVPWNQT